MALHAKMAALPPSLVPTIDTFVPATSNLSKEALVGKIDLVTVFNPIMTSRQTCEKLNCLYENPMSNNFRKTVVVKKI